MRPTRRVVLKVIATLPAAAWLPACGSDAPRGFFTATERRVLAACANAIYPPDDAGPGAADLGAVDFIDKLMTAFDHDPPHILAAGPFSGRTPFIAADGTPSTSFPDDGFAQFLPLTRVQDAGWRLRLFGSDAVGGGPNDGVLGPVVGLRDLFRDGIAHAIAASPTSIDQLDDVSLRSLYDLLPDDVRAELDLLVMQSLFALPEYGGNRRRNGWDGIYFEGDSMPLGYTYIADGQIVDRSDRPVIGPATAADPDPMDDEIIQLYSAAVVVLGGKQFY
jgi:hypothetical protein